MSTEPGLQQLSDATIEELTMFDLGHSYGQYKARIAAFGAIRRAAEVARKAEADAATLANQGSHDTAAFADSEALGIRRAIRAAIGSDTR